MRSRIISMNEQGYSTPNRARGSTIPGAHRIMKSRPALCLLIFTLAGCLSGCAPIVTGQDQLISLRTPNCPGAACTLENENGSYYVHETPGNVSVARAYGDLQVTCSKPGYEPLSIMVSPTMRETGLGNIIIGGSIEADVDIDTSVAYKYEYPDEIVVPLDCRVEKK